MELPVQWPQFCFSIRQVGLGACGALCCRPEPCVLQAARQPAACRLCLPSLSGTRDTWRHVGGTTWYLLISIYELQINKSKNSYNSMSRWTVIKGMKYSTLLASSVTRCYQMYNWTVIWPFCLVGCFSDSAILHIYKSEKIFNAAMI